MAQERCLCASLSIWYKCVFKQQDLKIFGLKLTKIVWAIFHPCEVVGPGSETQLQVGEGLICFINLILELLL